MVSSRFASILVFGLLVLALFTAKLGKAEYLRGVETRNIFVSRNNVTASLYRILSVGSMFRNENNRTDFRTTEEIACVAIKDGREEDDLYGIDLPREILDAQREKILAGKLFVSITGTRITEDSVEILDGGHIQVISDPRRTTRSVNPPAIGQKTVAVVLISTRDSSPSVNAQDLRHQLFNPDGVNLKTQFKACSAGQLNWELHGDRVLEVFVDESVKVFPSGSALVTAAQKVLRATLGIEDLSKIADKTLMCLPPGTGNWVASSGVGHWRAQFNDGWCRSLSATMHELGHTLGLNHANEGGVPYGDSTGYMAAGHKATDWPKKCFNGEMHWQLGWFFRRHQTMLLDDLEAGRLTKLATFVDYDISDYDEPVIVRIDDMFLQYNRAKEFNVGTEEKQDQVTVTRRTGSGSNVLAGLSKGNLYSEFFFDASGRTLLIEACGEISGNRGADVMVISVAIGRSLCAEFYADQKAVSSAMTAVNNHVIRVEEGRQRFTLLPTPTPITSPSTSPSHRATISPTWFPSVDPTVSPTSAPTPAPTLWTPKSLAMISQFWSLLASWRDRASSDSENDNQQSLITTTSTPAKENVVNTREVPVVDDHSGPGAHGTTPSMTSVLADEGFIDKPKGKHNQSGVQPVFLSSGGRDGV